MKESTTSFWPRGLWAGALLAACLIVPGIVVMAFDAAPGRLAADTPARFATFPSRLQLRAGSAFFDGRLDVQAVLSQRITARSRDNPDKAHGTWRDSASTPPTVQAARNGTLRLRLENRSAQSLEVEIVRVDSGLGGFVANPDRLELAPNQISIVDSPVGEQKFTARTIPVAVELRLGGAVETRQLVLNARAIAQAAH